MAKGLETGRDVLRQLVVIITTGMLYGAAPHRVTTDTDGSAVTAPQ